MSKPGFYKWTVISEPLQVRRSNPIEYPYWLGHCLPWNVLNFMAEMYFYTKFDIVEWNSFLSLRKQ
jgi:hypothetical protein